MSVEHEIQKLVDQGQLVEAAELAKINAINSLQMASLIYSKMGQEIAIDMAKYCLKLDPYSAKLYGNLSFFLGCQLKYEEALEAITKAVEISPTAEFYYNKAILLSSLVRIDEAIECYEKGLELSPDTHVAKFNLGCLYMLKGNYKKGLELLEWRFEYDGMIKKFRERFDKPHWMGQSLTGKKLLVYNEQGMGDAIQHVRYLPQLKAKGAYLIGEFQEELVPILSGFFDSIVARSQDYNVEEKVSFPDHDYVVSFSSLTYLLNPKLKNKIKIPYIFAPKENDFTVDKSKLNIGITWTGSSGNSGDINRSCPVRSFLPLSKIPNVQLHSLQKGSGKKDWNGKIVDLNEGIEELNLIHWEDHLTDFGKTSQLLEQLDLVISVCTSVAHLSGSMGRPTFLILSKCHDQRWLLDSDTTPLYDTMKIFIQDKLGNWDSVIQEVILSL